MDLIEKYIGEGKKDIMTNVWGTMQSIKSIKSDLEQAIKTKKDVFHSQTGKTMKNTDFIKKTKKLLNSK